MECATQPSTAVRLKLSSPKIAKVKKIRKVLSLSLTLTNFCTESRSAERARRCKLSLRRRPSCHTRPVSTKTYENTAKNVQQKQSTRIAGATEVRSIPTCRYCTVQSSNVDLHARRVCTVKDEERFQPCLRLRKCVVEHCTALRMRAS